VRLENAEVTAVANNWPRIDALAARETVPAAGGIVTLRVSAHDPDRDPLGYSWSSVDVELRKVPRRAPAFLEPDEVPRLLAQLSPRDRVIAAVAVYAGLRKGELFGLRKSDQHASSSSDPTCTHATPVPRQLRKAALADAPSSENSRRSAAVDWRAWRESNPRPAASKAG